MKKWTVAALAAAVMSIGGFAVAAQQFSGDTHHTFTSGPTTMSKASQPGTSGHGCWGWGHGGGHGHGGHGGCC